MNLTATLAAFTQRFAGRAFRLGHAGGLVPCALGGPKAAGQTAHADP